MKRDGARRRPPSLRSKRTIEAANGEGSCSCPLRVLRTGMPVALIHSIQSSGLSCVLARAGDL